MRRLKRKAQRGPTGLTVFSANDVTATHANFPSNANTTNTDKETAMLGLLHLLGEKEVNYKPGDLMQSTMSA